MAAVVWTVGHRSSERLCNGETVVLVELAATGREALLHKRRRRADGRGLSDGKTRWQASNEADATDGK